MLPETICERIHLKHVTLSGDFNLSAIHAVELLTT